MSEPPWVAATPSVRAPQLANPASAVVRPRPMPVVPAPCRATCAQPAVRVVDAGELVADRAHDEQLRRALHEVDDARRELAARRWPAGTPRGGPGDRSARARPWPRGRGPREGRGRPGGGTTTGRPRCPRRRARPPGTVAAPAAPRPAASPRRRRSAPRDRPRRKTGRPAGATASSRSKTRTRRSASTRKRRIVADQPLAVAEEAPGEDRRTGRPRWPA